MHLRDLVRRRWADAGLYSRKNAHLQSFLQHVDRTPLQCWDEYAALFRRDYYDLYDQLIPPLLSANDPLLRITLIRYTDFSQAKELQAMREFVRRADPLADAPELRAILDHGGGPIRGEFAARPDLASLVAPKIKMPVRKAHNMVPQPQAAHAKKARKKAKKKK